MIFSRIFFFNWQQKFFRFLYSFLNTALFYFFILKLNNFPENLYSDQYSPDFSSENFGAAEFDERNNNKGLHSDRIDDPTH